MIYSPGASRPRENSEGIPCATRQTQLHSRREYVLRWAETVMNLKLPTTMVILILTALQNSGTGPSNPQLAEVKGFVTDINRAKVPGASVEFTSKGRKYTALTSENGTYTIQLHPGTYKVRVLKFGFCDGRRGAFSLKENSRAQFDFQLLVCGTWDTEGISAPPSPPKLPDRYQEEELNAITANGIRPLITFGGRKVYANLVHYSGFEYQGRRYPVVYTYDLLTITADTLSYSLKDNSIEGRGDVIWQEGNEARRGSEIRVSYSGGKPKIALAE